MNKPILLTVDDDAAVSQAITRTLRRQYAQRFRVLRAESGPAALETLRELKLSGDEAALLLADHRMPGIAHGLPPAAWAESQIPSLPMRVSGTGAWLKCLKKDTHRHD